MSTSDEADAAGGEASRSREKSWRIVIDKVQHEIREATPTARHLLQVAGKLPPEQHALYLRHPGQSPARIALDDRVDLRAPGVERFVTLPLDQTEG